MTHNKLLTRLSTCAFLATTLSVQAADVRVTVTNDADPGGTYLTPTWVGFHDGSFDVFDLGAVANSGVEAVAEDGNPGPLGTLFAGNGLGGVVGGGPIAPGASASAEFSIAEDGSNSFVSFASMLLPSTDFFIGNDDPHALSLSGLLDGTFSAVTFVVTQVYDAGTEINDFATSAANGLFGIPGGQGGPNQGADENGVITIASGADYLAYLNLGGTDVAPFNFDNYESLATITIESVPAPVPVPASLPLIASAAAALGFVRRRQT